MIRAIQNVSSRNEEKGKKAMMVPMRSEKRPKGDPLYRDPDNPFNTWTGRGKRPDWLKEKLDAGKELVEMRIPGKKRSVASPKYQDPSNPDHTWSGEGRRPDWLKALLDSGINRDQLKI